MNKNNPDFWKKPEGKVGLLFLGGLAAGLSFLIGSFWPIIITLTQDVLSLSIFLVFMASLGYLLLDSRIRSLINYFFKTSMKKITGLFIKVDPIGVLKNHVNGLKQKLGDMTRQLNKLRGQMHLLNENIINNKKNIESNLELASKAKEEKQQSIMILKSRKAGRLKESNIKLEDLYKKMEVLYRVLTKMHENSFVLMEDVKDQVMVKEQEQKAIHTSHSAMQSAMSIIKGNPDKRVLFDNAMDAVAEDVSEKINEMERFMDMSANFMDSLDLQNGIFEENGLAMLENWEKDTSSLILGEKGKKDIISTNTKKEETLDLNQPIKVEVRGNDHKNQYDSFFEN
jgi:hypothetical protein